ncbi:MAG TPA: FlgD immunoglobulin-like domain containing protein [Candidatus Eisenbacteria bacterium]|nr:FlgD immunoglobulin-like domain containing protein [Candidatus Eisenbacteria bacterium]
MDWIKRVRKLAPLFLVIAISMGWSETARAAWLEDPSINLQVGNLSGVDQDPLGFSDNAGGALIVWLNTVTDRVYVQRVGPMGLPLWAAPVRATTGGGDEEYGHRAVEDGYGGVIIVWQAGTQGSSNLWAQRISRDGERLWGDAGVLVSGAAYAQADAAIVQSASGSFVVTWKDSRAGNQDIYAQRLNLSGATLWASDGVPVCTAAGDQVDPALDRDAAGGVIVAWTDGRSATNDIYAQRLSDAGALLWTAGGVPICIATGVQQQPVVSTNYLGTAIVIWMDLRTDGGDIYAQRIDPSGTTPWPIVGVPVCTAPGTQFGASALSGSTYVLVSWTDERNGATNQDIFAQRVNDTGAVAWAANGLAICTAPGNQVIRADQPLRPSMISPGSGIVIAWADYRGATADVYAQKFSFINGAVQWPVNGIVVSNAPYDQVAPVMVSDPEGGVIFAWSDYRDGRSIYSQLVRSGGEMGNLPPPAIVRVTDVPNDQGGRVQLEWGGSSKDYAPGFTIETYSVWRRVPHAPSSSPALSLASPYGTAPHDKTRIQTAGAGGQAFYWEYVTSVPARGFLGYSYVAETTSDSLGGSNPYTHFMVLAEEAGGTPFYASAADSGYSVDNLSPESPYPVGGQYTAGSVHVHWSRNAESDLSGYRMYKGSHAGFEPDASNLLGSTSDTIYVDPGPAGGYYKITALDVHGNESLPSLLSPAQITSAEPAEPVGVVRFGLPSPNPTSGNVSFDLSLPKGGSVRFSVYDIQGRAVSGSPARALAPGHHTFRWDGKRQDGTSCGTGVYYARLEVEGKTVGTRRVTIVR